MQFPTAGVYPGPSDLDGIAAADARHLAMILERGATLVPFGIKADGTTTVVEPSPRFIALNEALNKLRIAAAYALQEAK